MLPVDYCGAEEPMWGRYFGPRMRARSARSFRGALHGLPGRLSLERAVACVRHGRDLMACAAVAFSCACSSRQSIHPCPCSMGRGRRLSVPPCPCSLVDARAVLRQVLPAAVPRPLLHLPAACTPHGGQRVPTGSSQSENRATRRRGRVAVRCAVSFSRRPAVGRRCLASL